MSDDERSFGKEIKNAAPCDLAVEAAIGILYEPESLLPHCSPAGTAGSKAV